jgi:hypothetical protein
MSNIGWAAALATVFTLIGLFVVGWIKGTVARSSRIRSGLENMVIAGLGGLAAWWIGGLVGGVLA